MSSYPVRTSLRARSRSPSTIHGPGARMLRSLRVWRTPRSGRHRPRAGGGLAPPRPYPFERLPRLAAGRRQLSGTPLAHGFVGKPVRIACPTTGSSDRRREVVESADVDRVTRALVMTKLASATRPSELHNRWQRPLTPRRAATASPVPAVRAVAR